MTGERPGDAGGRPWRDLWAEVTAVLGSRQQARWLVEEASGYEGADLLTRLDEPATQRCAGYLSRMVERRAAGEPLQYVLGRWPFRRLDLMVDARVLIPRPETEGVVEVAIAEARRIGAGHGSDGRILAADLGTGSGAIGISLAVELGAEVWATDVSPEALDVARANLAGAGMFAATRVRMAEGWWWGALPADLRGRFDLVVSNPPYIGENDRLPPEVDCYEPRLALRAGADGMDAIAEVIAGAPSWISSGGALVVELAPSQAGEASALAEKVGARAVEVHPDALGRDRALVARW